MNRVSFFESISGITWPRMLVDFFDQFIALKRIVEDTGKVSVISSTTNSIIFEIEFIKNEYKNNALSLIDSLRGVIVIYNRNISITTEVLSDTVIRISLQ